MRTLLSAQPDLLIRKLIEKLRDSDRRTRRNAAGALGMQGTRALEAIPVLSALLSDSDPEVRATAERTLDHLRFTQD
jgi:HEAT repeat protein